MKKIMVLAFVFFSQATFAIPVDNLSTYVSLFRRFSSAEVCARKMTSFALAISEKNDLALELVRAIGGPQSCYRMGSDRLQHDSEAGHPYIACARVSLAEHCKW